MLTTCSLITRPKPVLLFTINAQVWAFATYNATTLRGIFARCPVSNIHEFITVHGITIECQRVPENPNMRPDPKDKKAVEWSKAAGHFLCVLIYKTDNGHGKVETFALPGTYYSVGSGHSRLPYPKLHADSPHNSGRPRVFDPPSVADLLDCLASDACSYENARDFEDWAADLGMAPDSRKAEATYRVVEQQAKELRNWLRPLGTGVYDELLFDTDRL